MTNPWVAALGGAASKLGENISEREKAARALKQLTQMQEMKEGAASVWGNTFPAEDEQGPGLFQENRRTGEVRRVQVSGGPTATAPSRAVKAIASSAGMFGTPTDTIPPAPRSTGIRPIAKPPVRDPVKEHAANRQYDVEHPLPVTTKPDEQLVLTQNPDNPEGPGIYTPRAKAIGQQAPGKPKIENAMQVSQNARLTAAVGEMNNAHQGMAEFEKGLADGTISINGLDQLIGSVGNAFTHDDPASKTIQNAALTALNHKNPALARYIRRGLSFAEGESMISQRPSDYRTKMAAFLSTAASGASKDMIADIESRRTSILNPLNEAVTNRKGAPKKVTPSASDDPEFDALMAKHTKKP